MAAILVVVLAVVLIQLYFVIIEKNNLKAKSNSLNDKLNAFNKENEKLKSEIEYFSVPENLEKELRAKFNYKKPGEKMIIIAP